MKIIYTIIISFAIFASGSPTTADTKRKENIYSTATTVSGSIRGASDPQPPYFGASGKSSLSVNQLDANPAG